MASYDFSLFPIIKIKFNHNLSDSQFNKFIQDWENIYSLKKYFIMIFYTDNLSPALSQCYQIASFIQKLKNEYDKLLSKSIFIINNYIIEKLLYFVFFIQKPISDIYIIKNYNKNINIDSEITNILNDSLSVNITHIPL
jgi:hypothetical protein